jgi:hypothetical protein
MHAHLRPTYLKQISDYTSKVIHKSIQHCAFNLWALGIKLWDGNPIGSSI